MSEDKTSPFIEGTFKEKKNEHTPFLKDILADQLVSKAQEAKELEAKISKQDKVATRALLTTVNTGTAAFVAFLIAGSAGGATEPIKSIAELLALSFGTVSIANLLHSSIKIFIMEKLQDKLDKVKIKEDQGKRKNEEIKLSEEGEIKSGELPSDEELTPLSVDELLKPQSRGKP